MTIGVHREIRWPSSFLENARRSKLMSIKLFQSCTNLKVLKNWRYKYIKRKLRPPFQNFLDTYSSEIWPLRQNQGQHTGRIRKTENWLIDAYQISANRGPGLRFVLEANIKALISKLCSNLNITRVESLAPIWPSIGPWIKPIIALFSNNDTQSSYLPKFDASE